MFGGVIMPGPPPSPNPRRRNPRPDATTLPAGGYQGPVPEWPFASAHADELEIWASLWRLPQAAAWAQMSVERTIARYCRALVVAEERDAAAALLSEVRQIEDRLGLTPMAMLRLRWVISTDELAEARKPQAAPSSLPRLRAVE
jgi:hypothetical protein